MATGNEAVQVTAVLTVLLWLKVVAVNFSLGAKKLSAGTRAPEDTYQTFPEVVPPEAAIDQDRTQRMVNNDLEKFPYTISMAWGSAFCVYNAGGSANNQSPYALTHIIVYSLFVVGRIGHSVAYSSGKSYTRTGFFVLGMVSSFVIAINGAIASFDVV